MYVATLRHKLANNLFVITAETNPPRGPDPSRVLSRIAEISSVVDAVNIADSPMAKMRMSPVALAHIVQEELGVETIVHFTCRDRNSIALQSDLLGAAALGIRNFLAITGDRPAQSGNHPDNPCPRAVFDVDAAGLVRLAETLNNGYDASGNKLSGVPDFFVGVVANPSAQDLDREVERLEHKVRSGAKFVQTQPVYDLRTLQRFREKTAYLEVPVLYGILPLKSYEIAVYLHEKVPGVVIPDTVRERVRLGGRRAGVELARELFAEIRDQVAGVHIFPMGDTDIVLEVTNGLEVRQALAT
ncbi:MAG TPA: 5,10-methylenetetrahydrofolate reductase [Firmicutes bacterium]|nr:5,10-methylenetetrahydrofolate reductase [Bacillota bacterium]